MRTVFTIFPAYCVFHHNSELFFIPPHANAETNSMFDKHLWHEASKTMKLYVVFGHHLLRFTILALLLYCLNSCFSISFITLFPYFFIASVLTITLHEHFSQETLQRLPVLPCLMTYTYIYNIHIYAHRVRKSSFLVSQMLSYCKISIFFSLQWTQHPQLWIRGNLNCTQGEIRICRVYL